MPTRKTVKREQQLSLHCFVQENFKICTKNILSYQIVI